MSGTDVGSFYVAATVLAQLLAFAELLPLLCLVPLLSPRCVFQFSFKDCMRTRIIR